MFDTRQTAWILLLFENLRLELRRGCLTVAVLAALRTEQYGYTLRKHLIEHGLHIDEGTLYPLLRRLETQALLVSEWREEGKRNKRFYRLSNDGEQGNAHSTARRVAKHRCITERDSIGATPWTCCSGTLQAVRFFLPRKRQDDIIRELSENLLSQD